MPKLVIVGVSKDIARWYKKEITELRRIRNRVLRNLKHDYGLEGYHLRTIHKVVSKKGRIYFYRKRYWYRVIYFPKGKKKWVYVGKANPEIERRMRKVEEILNRMMKAFPLYWHIENITIFGNVLIMDEHTYEEIKEELPEHLVIRPDDLL